MKNQFTVLALCFAVLTSCQPTQHKTKTDYNLDFEKLNSIGTPVGWGRGNDSSHNAFRVDSTIKENGKYSFLIDWTNGKDWTATAYMIPETFKGKSIKLTGYLKTENVTKGAGLWMRIDGRDKPIAFDNMQDRPVTGTTGWKQYTIELPYDQENAKEIVLGGLIFGTGKVWIDNLHVTIDGKDISEVPLYNKASSSFDIQSPTGIVIIIVLIVLFIFAFKAGQWYQLSKLKNNSAN